MIKNAIRSFAEIEIWTILSLFFFVAFFVGMLIWVFRLSRKHAQQMSQLPLNDNELN